MLFDAVAGARPMIVRLPIRVQTYDIDFAGHVNNAVYVRWLEDLRTEFVQMHYGIERILEERLVPVVHSINIVFKKPLYLMDKPLGSLWCAKIGRATMTLDAEIAIESTVHASATQRVMLLHKDTGKPAHVPLEMIETFREQNVPHE